MSDADGRDQPRVLHEEDDLGAGAGAVRAENRTDSRTIAATSPIDAPAMISWPVGVADWPVSLRTR